MEEQDREFEEKVVSLKAACAAEEAARAALAAAASREEMLQVPCSTAPPSHLSHCPYLLLLLHTRSPLCALYKDDPLLLCTSRPRREASRWGAARAASAAGAAERRARCRRSWRRAPVR